MDQIRQVPLHHHPTSGRQKSERAQLERLFTSILCSLGDNGAKWPFGFDLKENVTELGVEHIHCKKREKENELVVQVNVYASTNACIVVTTTRGGQICVIGLNIGTYYVTRGGWAFSLVFHNMVKRHPMHPHSSAFDQFVDDKYKQLIHLTCHCSYFIGDNVC